MIIDWTFRVSDLLAIIGFILAGIAGAAMLRGNVDRLGDRTKNVETKIDGLAGEVRRVAEILAAMARFEERTVGLQRQVDAHSRELEDLRNGRGWIVEPPEGARPKRQDK